MRFYRSWRVMLAIALIAAPGLSWSGGTPNANVPPRSGAGENFRTSAYDAGLAAAPKLLREADVQCDVRQALDLGDATLLDASGKPAGSARLFEAACSNDLGYLITERSNQPPTAIDCVRAAGTERVACMLPMNRHPAGGLDGYMKAAGVSCDALRARFVALDENLEIRRYEVFCRNGSDYILDISLPNGSGLAPKAIDCLAVEGQCHFVTHIQSVAVMASKMTSSLLNACNIGEMRHIGFVAAHSTVLYEISCRKGQEGQLIELTAAGILKSVRPCSSVKLVGATCELKPVDQIDPLVAIAEASVLSRQASDPVSPTMITHPDWLQRPSGGKFLNVYPEMALRSSVSGQATLFCQTTVGTSLRDCVVIDESPVGFGFGGAALKLSAEFKMRPEMVNGRPVDGATVMLPINFVFHR